MAGSGIKSNYSDRTLYDYSAIQGFEWAKGVINPPEELFAPFGGLEAYLRSLEAQAGAKASSVAASRTGRDETSERERNLLQPVRAMAIGDPVPVVFARRRTGGTGGVMVQPRATEAQFANTGTEITARYHCLLSEGQVGSIQVRDVRVGLYRRGSFSQNYGQRAGTWQPGNRSKPVAGVTVPDFPQNCGIGGNYKGVSTIEYSAAWPIDSDQWKLPLNVLIRNGMQIDRGRLLDDVVGASDNLCDLIIWALVKSGRKKESEINLDEMEKTALFLEANQLYCNAEFTSAASLPDWLVNILPSFLLREATIGGKYAVIPAVPTNEDGTIKTTKIQPRWTFTEEAIAPGSWQERPADAAARGPLEISVLWRQQTSETEPPLDRDLRVGRPGVDPTPQSEPFDLRGFATSEQHAALAGGFRHALRTLAGSTASVRVLPGSQSGYLQQGQIVQVFLQQVSERTTIGAINSLWRLDRIDLAPDGSESLQLSACPVDGEGRSLVALAVAAARDNAPGMILPYPPLSAGDEPGRASDTSVPPSTTSGLPFTSGGGGILPAIGRLNKTQAPNRTDMGSPPVEKPPAPPTPGGPGGGGIVQAGNRPKQPSETKGGGTWWNPYIPGKIEPIDYPPGPQDCKYGPSIISTRLTGLSLSSSGYGYWDTVIESTKRIEWVSLGFTFSDYWSPGISVQIETIRISYTSKFGYDVSQIISSCGVPPFGPQGEFGLYIESWRCKLANGATGPLQTP